MTAERSALAARQDNKAAWSIQAASFVGDQATLPAAPASQGMI